MRKLTLAATVLMTFAAQMGVGAPDLLDATAFAAQPVNDRLGRLFSRLAQAANAAETQTIAAQIEQIWLTGQGPTLELLMSRAISATQSQDYEIALDLLNHVVKLAPGWAEAWNKRATVRYLLGDDAGSLADIYRTLSLEPRHFGALAGEAMILQRADKKAEALQTYRQISSLAPFWPNLKQQIDHLSLEVEGQGI